MWDTSRGIRVLIEHEAALVREAISAMVDSIHDEASGFTIPVKTGVELFDRLSWTQRLTLLDQVASALLLPASNITRHSSAHDAAVGAIFSYVTDSVVSEIDMGMRCSWRQLVRDAYRNCFEPNVADADLLPMTLGDHRKDRWSYTTELLTDRVLHDRDYEMAGSFLDLSPDQAAVLRQALGIEDSYFVDVSDDVHHADAEALFRQIKQLTVTER